MKKNATILTVLVLFIAGVSPFGCTTLNNKTDPSDIPAADFDRVHAVTLDDTNKFLILGKAEVESPATGLSKDLQPFLGRWEGFNTNPPVKNDLRVALVIRSLNYNRGDGVIYYGYNLQYPTSIKNIHFEVSRNDGVSLEAPLESGIKAGMESYIRLQYQAETDRLTGVIALGSGKANYVGSAGVDSLELSRDRSFYVYKDYRAYLAGLRIHAESYKNTELNNYGNGYLIYLPEGYEDNTSQTWPLLFFLHGMGDRGNNVFILAKASPFKMIREKGPLPFIIVAPLLSDSPDFFSFPGKYLEGVLDEIAKIYRVDEKRVYLTGLSLGGEASYRFAMEHPEKIAAVASLGGLLAKYAPGFFSKEAAETAGIPLSRLKDVPCWQIHSANDAIVPLDVAKRTVADFAQSGVKVKFTVLENHDHDIWSDTYADPEFYKWFLQYKKG